MRSYFGTAISDNIGKTPEGYLICRNVVVSRTATKTPILYKESEVSAAGGDNKVKAWRRPETVFDRAAMSSLEGKPVCSPHPGIFLSPQNYAAYAKGTVLNVHRGPVVDGEETLQADLLITDQMLIDAILSGRLRECSVGYDCRYLQLDNGDYEQRDISCNHVAVIPQARVGSVASITDSAPEEDDLTISEAVSELRRINTLLERQQTVNAEDAQTIDELSYVLRDEQLASDFSAAVNEVGRRMRSRGDCRPGIRESADRRVQDAKVGVTVADDANAYARQMQAAHRK